ncbi:hypothetical protein P4C99_15935 [Pontiellaceae bacterium B1224]|nr:hypothetical protein [Pontiellaceae bacterium B1224]
MAETARSLAQTGETALLRSAAIVTLGEVGAADNGIVAEVVRGTGDHARSWSIKVHADDSLQAEKINDQIQLNVSSGTVNIPIIGTVKPVIQIAPDTILFPTRSAQEAERLIMLRRLRWRGLPGALKPSRFRISSGNYTTD